MTPLSRRQQPRAKQTCKVAQFATLGRSSLFSFCRVPWCSGILSREPRILSVPVATGRRSHHGRASRICCWRPGRSKQEAAHLCDGARAPNCDRWRQTTGRTLVIHLVGAAEAMYLFREFNETHFKGLRASIGLYLIALFAAWTVFSLVFETRIAFLLTMLVLMAAHAVRIGQLSKLQSRSRAALQNIFLGLMGVVVALLVVFAYSQAAASGPQVSWPCFRAVFLSMALASYLSAYLDFAAADLVATTDRI